MKMAPEFLSEKIPGRERINAIFADELKAHLYAFCLITLCMEICLLAKGNRFVIYVLGLPLQEATSLGGFPLHETSSLGGLPLQEASSPGGLPAAGLAADGFSRGAFVLSALALFFLFCVLEYTFRLFLGRSAAAFLSLFPAILFLYFLRDAEGWAFLRGAVIAAVVYRLLFIAVRLSEGKLGQKPRRGYVSAGAYAFAVSIFILDAAALCLRFVGHVLDGAFATDRYLFIVLAVMTLSALQRILCERNGSGFPFFYFALLGAILTMLPMRAEPIDWSPLAQAGERVAGRAADVADYVSYYLSPFLPNDSYTAGYSSLSGTGGRVSGSEKTQIILRTKEKPYYLYEDNETSQKRKVRRTVYLAGGEGVDKAGLVAFLRFLYGSGGDREYASLFSKISKVDVEYAYLETADMIAPAHAILLRDETGAVEDGVSPTRHKRGYRISSVYLDIDYGSPYLADLLRKKGDDYSDTELSYDTACSYMRELYGFDMGSLLTRGEYERLQPAGTVLLGQKNLAQKDRPRGLKPAQEPKPTQAREPDQEPKPTQAREPDQEPKPAQEPKPTQEQEPDQEPAQEPKPAQEPDDSPYIGTEGASARLRNLANELTQNADNAYDKCKIIEKYLRQYRYTTDAVGGYDPKSDMSTSSGMADIAERFLFDTREGYCVHFTSSMVMLLRLSGIPARAVSGYRYVFPFDGQDAYEVSSNCAHVWPEAYLANAGWISFEPTAAYRPVEDYTWRRESEGGVARERDDSGAEVPPFAEMQDGSFGQGALSQGEALSEGDALPEGGNVGKPETRHILQIAAGVASGILALVFVLIAGALIARRMRYALGSPEERLQMDVAMIRKILLRRAGEGFVDRGLLSDYVELAPEDFRPDIRRVFGAYYRIVYGGDGTGVSPGENELARQVRDKLRDSARGDGPFGPKIFGPKGPSPKDEISKS